MARIQKYQKAAEAGDNEFTGFVNYGVKKKPEGKYKLHRILMICGYVLFDLAYIIACTVLTKAAMFIALLPVLTWILSYFTWLYVNIEYEYTIVGGNMKFMEVYGMRAFTEICAVKVSQMTIIAPYSGDYRKEADDAEIEKRCYCVSSMSSPDIYFGIYTEGGKRCAVFFEATEKTLKVMKYYNGSIIMSKTRY